MKDGRPRRDGPRHEPTARVEAWFASRGWAPFEYQRTVWAAHDDGDSGLIHVATGMGKTLAAAGGPVIQALTAGGADPQPPSASRTPGPGAGKGGVKLLWVTPLRALARDTVQSLQAFLVGVGLGWTVELRTGDVSSSVKGRQRRSPPDVLVTTPESLSLLLSYPEKGRTFGGLETVVVDEWHELLGGKRGTQTELGLSHLRAMRPDLRVWGLSATLGNLDQALKVLLGPEGGGRLVAGPPGGEVVVETLVPDTVIRFPWSGHLGLRLLPQVLEELERGGTSLLFTNTRAQAELWHQALLDARPQWSEVVALHHGSISAEARKSAEQGLSDGTLRCVVCTSSLDLGVDFQPVDRVLQVGSPKGVGRLLQRAGRSGHRPGAKRRVVCVPTHALELLEFAAARAAVEEGEVEPREAPTGPLDVLAQHVVTLALAGGISAEAVYQEARSTWSFRGLSREAWGWVLDFVVRGGPALQAYPRYRRLVMEDDDRLVPAGPAVTRSHRQAVGTIADEGTLSVRFLKGRRLGSVEEAFLSRLRPGDRFLFSGRVLELVRVKDMVAYVRRATRSGRTTVPRWAGGRLPLSSHLARWVAAGLAGDPRIQGPELDALEPLLDLQRRWSRLPGPERLVVEVARSREGHHAFLFTFLGRLAHEGLGALLAWRLSQIEPRTVGVALNDYGIELLSPDPFPEEASAWRSLLDPAGLEEDLPACLNAAEMARRRFRQIARVSGLVHPGPPGRSRSTKNLQASSGLLYDVLARYDPDNLLVDQAHREVLERELEATRLRDGLGALAQRELTVTHPPRFTPLAFPIWAERLQSQVSSESWLQRVQRMAESLEAAAGNPEAATGNPGAAAGKLRASATSVRGGEVGPDAD